ncbi:hypothetical protein [Azonexus hydrophilus]|uniref:hypothetical protein n=1 Tax=Azonexus hydrophilus TaxID=418702 RepID=UPI002490B2BA|nr:hypothetical protein [Azonexus hydrophilus]
MEHADMPLELRLAAVIHLLSSSALRGATFHKTEALRTHLRSVADSADLNPHLKSTLQEVLGGWEAVHCHPASVPVDCYPLAHPGCQTH